MPQSPTEDSTPSPSYEVAIAFGENPCAPLLKLFEPMLGSCHASRNHDEMPPDDAHIVVVASLAWSFAQATTPADVVRDHALRALSGRPLPLDYETVHVPPDVARQMRDLLLARTVADSTELAPRDDFRATPVNRGEDLRVAYFFPGPVAPPP